VRGGSAAAYLPWIIVLALNSRDPERLPGPVLSFAGKIAFIFGGLLIGNAYAGMKTAAAAGFAGIFLLLFGLLRLRRLSARVLRSTYSGQPRRWF